MAGVGFELRRMIDQRRGFVGKVRAYSCAALIASGPWLMTILTLTLLNVAGPYLGDTQSYSLFRALVTYAFAFSLVLQGIAQMAVTRWVADLLYARRYAEVLPAFAACLIVTGAAHALIGGLFCLWAGFAPLLAALATTLFTIIGMTWIALIWLNVVRQYDDVLRAYVYGTLIAMVGVLLVFLSHGTESILAAYTAGQAFTLILLLRTGLRGMESGGSRDFSVFKSLVSFPVLAGVGFAYNAAIWVDKAVFWFADGYGSHPLVRYHPLYDTCSFLAYLTVVPALAVNLVQLETSFYEKYRAYYGAILAGAPLKVIETNRRRMFESLREGIVRLLRLQGAVTVAVIVFAPVIMQTLELPEIAARMFRLTCLGAGFHVLLLICVLMQMYFDLRMQALATSTVFFLLNGLFAWWSVNRGIETYGVGYALASFLTLLLGFVLLHRSLDRLDYHTFTSQPIGSKEERREAERLAEEERQKEEAEREKEAQPAAAPQERPAPVAVPEEIPYAAGEMGTIETEEPAPAETEEPAVEVVTDTAPEAAPAEPPAAPEPEPEPPAPEPVETATDLADEQLRLATATEAAALATAGKEIEALKEFATEAMAREIEETVDDLAARGLDEAGAETDTDVEEAPSLTVKPLGSPPDRVSVVPIGEESQTLRIDEETLTEFVEVEGEPEEEADEEPEEEPETQSEEVGAAPAKRPPPPPDETEAD